ncbi:hypothetical protein ASD24_20005 [Paenibacillus sp. Root52]|nr:hypothetical protein ASD24_20005 [Paenibacillus sp. Root52]
MKGRYKLKKILALLMLVSAVCLSGCASNQLATDLKQAEESSNELEMVQQQPEVEPKFIASSEDERVKLYAIQESKGEIEGVTVDIEGRQQNFDWSVPNTGTDMNPQVFYTDLTGDGREEAVIIIQTGKGTGLDHFDMHVIRAEDFSVIKVQQYEEIVADQIESHVTANEDGTLAITVKVQGQEHQFNSNVELTPNSNQNELAFGGVVIYALENQRIISRLGASIGTSPQYVCDFKVTYTFDHVKNEFVADQIEIGTYE